MIRNVRNRNESMDKTINSLAKAHARKLEKQMQRKVLLNKKLSKRNPKYEVEPSFGGGSHSDSTEELMRRPAVFNSNMNGSFDGSAGSAESPLDKHKLKNIAQNVRALETRNTGAKSPQKRNQPSPCKTIDSPWQKKPAGNRKQRLNSLQVSGKAFSQAVTP